MTITTSGSLLYGYDLGGGDAPWKLATADTTGGPGLAWYDPTAAHSEAANFADFADQAHRHLLAAIGIHTDPDLDGYELHELAAEHAGVHIERYSWEAARSFALAAHTTTAYYDSPTVVALLDLDHRRTTERWNERLTAAIGHLGLVPRAPSPQWLLISAP
jgi:hypothetical protein